MLNEGEIKALVALLDDDDDEVFQHVHSKLLSFGSEIVPILEQEWGNLSDSYRQQRVEDIIHRIQYRELLVELQQWYQSDDQDLLTGVCLIARYRYPRINQQQIQNEIDKIRLDVWLEMHYDTSPYEKVRIINHVLYNNYGFKGNVDNYYAPENSFINVALESRKGNHIMSAVIYMLVAQRLHLPIFGVNLPQHFVCAYKEENIQFNHNDPFNIKSSLDYRDGRVLFYINAFNKGAVFSRANLEQFLRQVKVEQRTEFFEPCSSLDIVKRMLRNLVVAFEKEKKEDYVDDVKEMLLTLGETYFSYNEEEPPETEEE
jgi:regulator of sirC expression with transglutaminase-like and TPR domain